MMGVKDHSGAVERIDTWSNSHGELEMKMYGGAGFLWHFSEDDSIQELEKGRFYCPIYQKREAGRTIRKSRHLFYILIPEDDSGDTVFVEIGPDGYVNRTYQSAERLRTDIDRGNLLPMWQVSSFGERPEDTISALSRVTQ